MAAKTSSKTSGGKILDITHPSKVTPPATSKPVIVSNRPIIKDPMVSGGAATPLDIKDESEPATTSAPVAPSKTKLVIQPLSEKDKETPVKEPAAKAEESVAEPELNEEEPDQKEAEPEVMAEKPEPIIPEVEASSEDVNDDGPESTSSSIPSSFDADEITPPTDDTSKPSAKPDQDEIDAAAAERQATLEKLIESKQFFLPINSVHKRKNRRILKISVTLLVLIVVAVGGGAGYFIQKDGSIEAAKNDLLGQ